jgi:hypothetical protein
MSYEEYIRSKKRFSQVQFIKLVQKNFPKVFREIVLFQYKLTDLCGSQKVLKEVAQCAVAAFSESELNKF